MRCLRVIEEMLLTGAFWLNLVVAVFALMKALIFKCWFDEINIEKELGGSFLWVAGELYLGHNVKDWSFEMLEEVCWCRWILKCFNVFFKKNFKIMRLINFTTNIEIVRQQDIFKISLIFYNLRIKPLRHINLPPMNPLQESGPQNYTVYSIQLRICFGGR